MTTEKRDIYQEVTNAIVEAIEAGTAKFQMPWKTSAGFPFSPINAISKKPYRGINTLILWASAEKHQYASGLWGTFKQWQELGAQVKKGEKATRIVFWKFFEIEEEEESTRRIPMARDYAVFNVAQVEGFEVPASFSESPAERITEIDAFFAHQGIEPKLGGNAAYYDPRADQVYMPPFQAFKTPLHYYAVLSHEATHWTGAAHRLNRDLTNRFGSEAYAMEELIAELGSAFLSAELGLPSDPRTQNAPYVASWLKALKNDKRAIFTAAAKAQEAADFLSGRRAPEEAE